MPDLATDEPTLPTGPTGLDSPAPPAAPPAPAPAQPAQQDTASPDLSEQEQSVLAKVAADVGELKQRLPAPEPEPAPAPDDFLRVLQGEDDDDFMYEDEPEPQPQPGFDPNQPAGEQAPQQMTGDPRVDQIIQAQNATLEYLQQREEQERTAQLNAFADQNPKLREPDVLREVVARTQTVAERAGDPRLRNDPEQVAMAYKAVMFDRAQTASAAQTTEQPGASIETGGGASVEAGSDPTDQYWAEIEATGGSAFPS